jgi:hypothetical protein
MGWLRVEDVIEIFELYQGWTRFRPIEGCEDLTPLNSDYNQYWIEPDMEARFEPYEQEPDPDPDDPITFLKAGEALDTLVRFLKQAWSR